MRITIVVVLFWMMAFALAGCAGESAQEKALASPSPSQSSSPPPGESVQEKASVSPSPSPIPSRESASEQALSYNKKGLAHYKTEDLVMSGQGDPPESRLPEVDAFPLHSEPLATDWGNEYKMGELILEDGCLRILEDPDLSDRDDFVPSFLPIWPEGFAWSKGDTAVEIFNPSGQRIARVGDYIRISGDGIHSERHRGKQIAKNLTSDCEGPIFLVGDDVTTVESDEREVVPIPDSDIYFRRVKTEEVGLTPRAVPAYGYSRMPSTLTLEDDCILLVNPNGEKYVPEWPAGFTPHLENGQLEVRNGGGRTIARIGDRLRTRGGIARESQGGVNVPECGALLLRVLGVINADLPLAFLKHEDRWKPDTKQNKDSIEGEIDVRNGCMHINNNFLWWPSDYGIEEEGDIFRVLNGMGEAVAEKGQETVLKGHRIRSDDKFGSEIIRMMPIDCPPRTYWIVTGQE